jgi:hypothetical protein
MKSNCKIPSSILLSSIHKPFAILERIVDPKEFGMSSYPFTSALSAVYCYCH